MFAIAKIKGFQYKLSEGQTIRIPKIKDLEGDNIEFQDVLMISKGDELKIGNPFIEGALVKAKIISHGKEDKINIVKYKRRKRYLKNTGFRKQYTDIEITGIKQTKPKITTKEEVTKE